MRAERRRRPRVSPSALAARRGEMPIIDSARVPLEELQRRAPRRALWLFVWLKVLRPLLVAALWLFAVRYAWTRIFGVPDDLPLWQQGTLYGAAIVLIVLAMLALAGARRQHQERWGASSSFPPSTIDEMSTLTNIPAEDLEQWQRAQRLVVHHDDEGMVARAEADGPR